MAQIMATEATMKTKASDLQQTNAQFKVAVDKLQTLQKTLDSQWDGDANTAFNTAFNKDKAKFDKFHSEITKYINALSEIIVTYSNAEKKNYDTASTRSYK